MTYSARRTRWLRALTAAALVLFVLALLMDFLYVGPEKEQGEAQRIFYVHLGSFLGAFISFGVSVLTGVMYLLRRDARWDVLSLSGVEMGLGFSGITILTGMAWAKPIWQTWWTWEPRLTSVAIMWLAYAAYMMLRAGIEDPEQRQRFAAVYSVLAFGSVVFTIIIVRVRPDTIHPVIAGPTQADPTGSFEVTGRIRDTLLFNLFVFAVITVALLWHRVRLENLARLVEQRKLQALTGHWGD
ncbi:MAG: cytochrome c biogenesis protein CcsA [Anaerolineae bacterium]|nr:cytochrome c biogenesis protein CcsA [Anaerolineae bacterium]